MVLGLVAEEPDREAEARSAFVEHREDILARVEALIDAEEYGAAFDTASKYYPAVDDDPQLDSLLVVARDARQVEVNLAREQELLAELDEAVADEERRDVYAQLASTDRDNERYRDSLSFYGDRIAGEAAERQARVSAAGDPPTRSSWDGMNDPRSLEIDTCTPLLGCGR